MLKWIGVRSVRAISGAISRIRAMCSVSSKSPMFVYYYVGVCWVLCFLLAGFVEVVSFLVCPIGEGVRGGCGVYGVVRFLL